MNVAVLRPDSSWSPPPITVFIAGSGRSGSNLVCSAMGRTGILGRPQEWLNLREMRRLYPREISIASDCCRMIRSRGATPNGIVSTKLLANHFLRLEGQIVLGEWFPNQSWIHLRRKDRLGQAISRTIAVQTGNWAAGSSGPSRRVVPSYSREQISANLEQIEQADRMWADYFAAEGIEPLKLWYEDLERDLHGPMTQIAEHVGGAPLTDALHSTRPFVSGSFDIKLARQRNATNAEWRVRYTLGT